MAKRTYQTIAEYIAAQPKDARRVLKRLRTTIRKAVPRATEGISYQIPVFKLQGRPVVYFAGWTHHYSIYPANGSVVSAFKEELGPYKISRGTIRFSLAEPVPTSLITRIAKFRAKQITGA